MVEGERRPFHFGHHPHRSDELPCRFGRDGGALGAGVGRRQAGAQQPRNRLPFAGPAERERAVHGDARQPRRESGPGVKGPELPPGAQERVLHDVALIAAALRQPPRHTPDHEVIPVEERAERVTVSGEDELYEVAIADQHSTSGRLKMTHSMRNDPRAVRTSEGERPATASSGPRCSVSRSSSRAAKCRTSPASFAREAITSASRYTRLPMCTKRRSPPPIPGPPPRSPASR